MFPDAGGSKKVQWSEETLRIAKEIDNLDNETDNQVNIKKVDFNVWQKYADEYGIQVDAKKKKISLSEIMQNIENVVRSRQEAKEAEEKSRLAKLRTPVEYKGYTYKLEDNGTELWFIYKDGNQVFAEKSREKARELIDKMAADDKRVADTEYIYKYKAEVEALAQKQAGKCTKNSKQTTELVKTKDGKQFMVTLSPMETQKQNYNMKTGKSLGTTTVYAWLIEIKPLEEFFATNVDIDFGLK